MGTIIYHFSGTGNSFKIAQDLAERLGETRLVPLARAEGKDLTPEADVVGIVFPVYAFGPPSVVMRFLEKIRLTSETYVFAVCSCAGSAGATLGIVQSKLRKRGVALSSGFAIRMPSNYIVWSGAPPAAAQNKLFARAGKRINEIAAAVKDKANYEKQFGGSLLRLLTGWVHRISIRAFQKQDRKFITDQSCNGCGLCSRICPVHNIELKNERPAWLHHCEQCLACLQWCPQKSIQIGKRTEGRTRYHHPDVTAQDLM